VGVARGDVVILGAKTAKGKNRIREHGDRWLVREVDRSVLSKNLGFLVCPASYRGTGHLNPKYDTKQSIFQVDGYCRWVRNGNDPDFEIVGNSEGKDARKKGVS
jgi:hypothetical protein